MADPTEALAETIKPKIPAVPPGLRDAWANEIAWSLLDGPLSDVDLVLSLPAMRQVRALVEASLAERDRLQAQLDAIRPRAQAIYDRWQYDDADIDARAILHIIDGPTPPAGTETTDG